MNTLLEQYKTIKAKYPDAVLLFRVGDFYETFGEDAKIISTVLGVILLKSHSSLTDSASVPFYALMKVYEN